jgi:hypothetical protein
VPGKKVVLPGCGGLSHDPLWITTLGKIAASSCGVWYYAHDPQGVVLYIFLMVK